MAVSKKSRTILINRQLPLILAGLLAVLAGLRTASAADSFRFVILGDRTGEAEAGVYEQIWSEAVRESPAFVVGVGDTIEGLNDQTVAAEWRGVDRLLRPFQRFQLYLAPGNHDIWSPRSERLFLQHAPGLHYSFDYGQVHFTILDNSQSDELRPEELAFLETDLKAHAAQPVKFIVSHRPSWLADAAMQNTRSALQQLARRYGVQYIVAGHVHQMLHFELEGVTYVSMVSSGGHLRASGAYRDGWFFGYALVRADGTSVDFQIKEASLPHGQGRITKLADWGMNGLAVKRQAAAYR